MLSLAFLVRSLLSGAYFTCRVPFSDRVYPSESRIGHCRSYVILEFLKSRFVSRAALMETLQLDAASLTPLLTELGVDFGSRFKSGAAGL